MWTHSHEAEKLGQFGWRCTNKESSYGNDTLIGNWNEERFDIQKMKVPKKMPSQVSGYCSELTLGKKATIHQVTTMLIKVSGHQHRWLAGGYDLEIGHFWKWLAPWLPGG